MRLLLIILGIGVGVVGVGNHAEAQNYPWCAYYGGDGDRGGTNCGFTTLKRCLDTVSGIGGFCQQNNLYQLPSGLHPLSGVQRRYSYPY